MVTRLSMVLLLIGTFAFPAWGRSDQEQASLAATRDSALSYISTRNYVHQWLPLPALTGTDLEGEPYSVEFRQSYLEIVIFISSSCIPCQHLMAPMRQLAKLYSSRNVQFTYVFTHDMPADAREFARLHQLANSSSLIAGHDLLKAYHDPLLPTVYVGDRHGWLLARFSKTDPSQLKELKQLLKYMTAF